MIKIVVFSLLLSLTLYSKDVTLLLPWKHQFQFAGYYMAKEKGFYKEYDLDVRIKELSLGEDVAKEVSLMKSEFGIKHSGVIIDKINTYKNLKILAALYQSSPLVIAANKANVPLQKIKNRTLLMSHEDTDNAALLAMLFLNDIDKKSYQQIYRSFNLKQFMQNELIFSSVYISNEPYYLQEKGIKYTLYNPQDYGYDFYSDILFTSQELIEKDPQMVQNFYKASMQGWEYAFKNKEETALVILKHYDTQNKTKSALLYEAKVLQELAYKNGVTIGDVSLIKLQEITNTYRYLHFIPKTQKIDFKDFIYKINRDKKMNEEETLQSVSSLYHQYHATIRFIFAFIIFTLLSLLYFAYKFKHLLKKKTQELEKSYEIVDQNISVSKTDLAGRITYVSEAFCLNTGYSKEELMGQDHKILKDKTHLLSDIFYKELWLSIASGHTWKGEFKNLNKDGTECWIEAVISPIFNAKHETIGYEAIRQDVTLKKVLQEFNIKLAQEVKEQTKEIHANREHFKKIAITDKLTGLYNRFKIDEEMENNFAYYKKHQENFSIIIIDIDFFKKINDTYGHQIGDEVLKELARTVQAELRKTDTFGRWGGEEFMIICPHTDAEGAFNIAQIIRAKIDNHSFPRVKDLTISAGVAEINTAKNIDFLIRNADTALYRAKDSGRNRVER